MKRAAMINFQKKAQAVLEELWPAVVVVDGKEYPAAGGGSRAGSAFVPGGELASREESIRVRRESLERPWAVGQRLVYRTDTGEERYRVVEVVQANSDVAWYFRCESPEGR